MQCIALVPKNRSKRLWEREREREPQKERQGERMVRGGERERVCMRMDRDSASQEDFIMYLILIFIDFATFVFQCF